jgi:hypothetical protein
LKFKETQDNCLKSIQTKKVPKLSPEFLSSFNLLKIEISQLFDTVKSQIEAKYNASPQKEKVVVNKAAQKLAERMAALGVTSSIPSLDLNQKIADDPNKFAQEKEIKLQKLKNYRLEFQNICSNIQTIVDLQATLINGSTLDSSTLKSELAKELYRQVFHNSPMVMDEPKYPNKQPYAYSTPYISENNVMPADRKKAIQDTEISNINLIMNAQNTHSRATNVKHEGSTFKYKKVTEIPIPNSQPTDPITKTTVQPFKTRNTYSLINNNPNMNDVLVRGALPQISSSTEGYANNSTAIDPKISSSIPVPPNNPMLIQGSLANVSNIFGPLNPDVVSSQKPNLSLAEIPLGPSTFISKITTKPQDQVQKKSNVESNIVINHSIEAIESPQQQIRNKSSEKDVSRTGVGNLAKSFETKIQSQTPTIPKNSPAKTSKYIKSPHESTGNVINRQISNGLLNPKKDGLAASIFRSASPFEETEEVPSLSQESKIEVEETDLSKSSKTVVVNYNYESSNPDDLNVKQGTRLTVQTESDDWYLCRNEFGDVGWVPKNFVIEETDEEFKVLYKAQVLYDFNARAPDELSCERHQIVDVLQTEDRDWWKVSNEKGFGLVPSNFLRKVTNEEIFENPFESTEPLGIGSNTGSYAMIFQQQDNFAENEAEDDAVPVEDSEKRKQAVQELLNTERTYQQDLRVMLKLYLEPISKMNYRTDIIFHNIHQVLDFSVLLMKKFESLNLSKDSVGTAYLECLEELECYKSYCENMATAIAYLQELRKANTSLDTFLKVIFILSRTSNHFQNLSI